MSKCFCGKEHQPVAAYGAWCCPDALAGAEVARRLDRQAAFPACRYCGDRVGVRGAVHSNCERNADRLIDEDES